MATIMLLNIGVSPLHATPTSPDEPYAGQNMSQVVINALLCNSEGVATSIWQLRHEIGDVMTGVFVDRLIENQVCSPGHVTFEGASMTEIQNGINSWIQDGVMEMPMELLGNTDGMPDWSGGTVYFVYTRVLTN